MKPEHFTSTLSSGGELGENSLVLTTNGRTLGIMVQTPNGRGFIKHLTPVQIHELKAMIANWEKLYYEGLFEV